VANVALLPPDAHGGCPQPRCSGDAIVPEWARRNLVTLKGRYKLLLNRMSVSHPLCTHWAMDDRDM